MTHAADETFFEIKREWSQKKDQILSHYLQPYLAKVSKLGKPILLVDGFAGPGKFEDGSPGSPLIMCQRAETLIARGSTVEVVCIEKLDTLYERLRRHLGEFQFAKAKLGSFLDYSRAIREHATTHTTFVYLDPYAIRGLEWEAVVQIASVRQTHDASVELLINLNVPAFARSARAALARSVPELNPAMEDLDAMDTGFPDTPSKENLNVIAGGDWWCEIVLRDLDFPAEVRELMNGFATQMRRLFREVCFMPIKARESHSIPKYYLAFGTRTHHGLILMNDEMVKASRGGGFQTELFTNQQLDEFILTYCETGRKRPEIEIATVREMFCRFTKSEIRRRIDDLERAGELRQVGFATKKDDEILRRSSGRLF